MYKDEINPKTVKTTNQIEFFPTEVKDSSDTKKKCTIRFLQSVNSFILHSSIICLTFKNQEIRNVA